MNAKKLLILTVTFSVLSVGAVVASSPWGDFKEQPIVKVQVNGTELATGDVPAFLVDGHAVAPLAEISRALQGLVHYDETTGVAEVYKPNVHMIIGNEVTKDGSVKQSFGKVAKGDTLKFVVFAQVDNLETGIHSFQIEITDPNGVTVATSDTAVMESHMESFFYPWPFEVTFDTYGKYRVKFLMKLAADDPFTVVSEKIITAE